jgi:restriction system protein
MAIPEYQKFMLPLLKYANDDDEHKIADAYEDLAKEFQLTDEEKEELLPSGTQQLFKNRIGWARTYLAKAGLLQNPKRGFFRISDRGKSVLSENPTEINNDFLRNFDEFQEFQKRSTSGTRKSTNQTISSDSDQTPEEAIENSIEELNSELSNNVLESLSNVSPGYFEQIVVDLLVSMGYGGSRKEAGRVIGKSGDGGIDGIINEDKLGLDVIYIQAKRWENVVSRPEIQKFVGALQGRRAKKGIFITTSRFSREASEYVEMIDNKVILIDGPELAQLMIQNNVGVTTIRTYHVKKLDSDFFIEE